MPQPTAAEERGLAAVDQSWVVERLSALVRGPSVGGTPAEDGIQHLLARWLTELDCAVGLWPIHLAEAATAPDAPGQEVERTEAWGVVGTAPGAGDGTPALLLGPR